MTALLLAAPSHVIVDNFRTPGAGRRRECTVIIAVITLLAVFLQIAIAIKTLGIANKPLAATLSELELANNQPAESQL